MRRWQVAVYIRTCSGQVCLPSGRAARVRLPRPRHTVFLLLLLCVRQLQGSNHGHVHVDSVVKIKSLPFDATQLDIIQFFAEFKLKPNGVQLVVRSDNKPTGEVRACQRQGPASPPAGQATQRHPHVSGTMLTACPDWTARASGLALAPPARALARTRCARQPVGVVGAWP